MELKDLDKKLKAYYVVALLGVVFAVIGFSYNAWRLEVSEDNSNVRTAAFEVLTNLAEFEQLIYAAHYDKDPVKGNPRDGWVKIGLMVDLSTLIGSEVEARAKALELAWKESWESVANDPRAVDSLVVEIESVRVEIKSRLIGLD